MKSSKKALALALAAAMVVTGVPVTNAEAATTAKLGATKATVYVGSSKYIAVNTPSSWKSVKLAVSSSNKSVASVKKNNAEKKIKVTAVKAGTAKVTVKVTAKKSGKTVKKTLTANVTVKDYKVRLTADGKTVSGTELTAAVGTPVELVAKTAPAKDTVTFKSSDETIATVDAAGKVTPVKAGKVTITASTAKAEDSVTVDVKNYILKDVKQTKYNTLEAVIGGKTSALKKTDFALVNTATKAVVAINEIKPDAADASKVTITTYGSMTDGKGYSLTLEGISKEFTASDGKVVSLGVTPTQIPKGEAKTISMEAKDAAGIVVYEAVYGKQPSDYTFTIDAKNSGYTTADGKLYLTKAGDTAVAKVVKHSWKYEAGKEVDTIESGEITITATEQAAVSGYQVRIADDNNKKFDDVKDNNVLAAGTNKVAMFKITNANGDQINYSSNVYTVSSSDPTVMQIAGTIVGSDKNNGIGIYGLKEGSAYILIKDKDNNVVSSLPISVVAAAKPATLSLDKHEVKVSTATNDSATVKATIKDQRGNDYSTSASVKVKLTNSSVNNSTYTGTANGKTVEFSGNTAPGKYVFEIYFEDASGKTNSEYVTVTVANPSGVTDYELDGDKAEVDTKISTSAPSQTTGVNFTLYETRGGYKYNPVATVKSYEVQRDGKTVYKTGATNNDSLITEAGGVLTITTLKVDGTNVQKITAGKYVVIATVESTNSYVRRAELTVKDSQSALSVTQKNNKTKKTDVISILTETGDDAAFKLECADAGNNIVITKVEGSCAAQSKGNNSDLTTVTAFNNNDVVTITKIYANLTVNGYTYSVELPVSFVVTVTR